MSDSASRCMANDAVNVDSEFRGTYRRTLNTQDARIKVSSVLAMKTIRLAVFRSVRENRTLSGIYMLS